MPLSAESPGTGGSSAVILNVTTKLNKTIEDAWLQWMNAEHIPSIIATGCFTRALMLRLLEIDETDGPTYAVQYFANNHSLYEEYRDVFVEGFSKKARDKWGDAFISFHSVLQVVN